MMLSKKTKAGLLGVLAFLLMAATVPLAIWITHATGAQLENGRRRCEEEKNPHQTRTVIIENDKVVPAHTAARQCDKLIITNLDGKSRLMAFGVHESHISYDGVSEKLLSKDKSIEVTLIKPGSYLFHDHADDAVRGTFTVEATRQSY